MPRVVEPYMPHVPHPGPQQLFLCLGNLEVFYGGAAGGGKSDALLMAATQYVDVPGYAALILRRTWSDLTQPGALMDRAWEWFKNTPAKPIAGGRSWRFPSGARIVFGYVQYHRDVEQFASAEYQFIGIDELTRGWEKRTYEFLFSRLRKPDWRCRNCRMPVARYGQGWLHRDPESQQEAGIESPSWGCSRPEPDTQDHACSPEGIALPDVPLRMRTASNPGGVGHKWVKQLLVDPKSRRPGSVFVPASLRDNPSLNQAQYVKSLEHLGPIERERLLRGDWEVIDEGNVFRRHWFGVVREEGIPGDCEWCRYWDLAATGGDGKGGDPDYTAGALLGLSRSRGDWWLLDVRRMQGTPFEVQRLVESTMLEDERRGMAIRTRMEQEGGSAGVNTIDHYRRQVFVGHDFNGDRPSGNKLERARPWSTAAEAGNFNLVLGPWIEDFLDECELFDGSERNHDDQVDAVSGAVKILGWGRRARIIV